MKEYDVKITETLEKTITVQAESRDAAEEQVKTSYYNSEYILDAENFTGVEFGTQDEREIQHEQVETLNVLLVRPNMYPQAVEIGCELEDLQKAVRGDIEAVYPFEEPVALVMNEEGKLNGSELNRALRDSDVEVYRRNRFSLYHSTSFDRLIPFILSKHSLKNFTVFSTKNRIGKGVVTKLNLGR